MKTLIIIFLCALPLSAYSANANPPDPITNTSANHFKQEFEAYIESQLASDTPGLAISIVLDGKPVMTKGYGVQKNGSNDLIDTETVFRLASVSKTIASAAAGTLVQNKQLQWDNRVTDYLDNLKIKESQQGQMLTINHLLSHRTGFVPHAYTNLVEDNVSYENILQKLDQVPYVCPPGTCYGYQNVVFSLIGDIVSIVSKSSYEQYVRDNIFLPLNMTNASYGKDNFLSSKNHATPHVWNARDKQWKPVTVNSNYYHIAPAAGANASISDMNNWLLAQMGHYPAVLNDSTLEAMHRKHVRTTRYQAHYHGENWHELEGTYYGLGWRIFDYGGYQGFVHHGGWVQGTRTEIVFHKGLQLGMVFLTNSETRTASKIVPAFLQIYFDSLRDRSQPVAKARD